MEINRENPVCPYCATEYHDYYLQWNVLGDESTKIFTCRKCNEKFEAHVTISYSFDTFEIEP